MDNVSRLRSMMQQKGGMNMPDQGMDDQGQTPTGQQDYSDKRDELTALAPDVLVDAFLDMAQQYVTPDEFDQIISEAQSQSQQQEQPPEAGKGGSADSGSMSMDTSETGE